MRTLVFFVLCLGCCASRSLVAQQPGSLTPPPMPRAQAEIYSRVTSRVLAPCCWSQPVQSHQSDAAARVRAEVADYLARGIGEPEIFNRLAAEYGERILGEPRGTRGTIAIVTPFAILLAGLAVVLFVLSRLVRRQARLISYAGPLPDLSELEL